MIEALAHHLAFIPMNHFELTATEFAEILIEQMQWEGYALVPIANWNAGKQTVTTAAVLDAGKGESG